MKLNLSLFKNILAVCLLGFFAIGAFMGGNLFNNFKFIKEPQPLNLLIYNHFISPEVFHDIENNYNLKINVDYADSLFEIEDKLKDPKAKYDLISIYSFQALELDEEARLQPINWSLIKNLKNISSDFMSLGGDELSKKLLPLSWGVNGIAYDESKFEGPIESWEQVLIQLPAKEHILLMDIPLSLFQLGQLKSKSLQKNAASEQNLKNALSNLMKFADLYHLGSAHIPLVRNYALIEAAQAGLPKETAMKSFKFVIPKEGGLFWTLNLAEPRFAPHPKEIAVFLGAILEKKVALSILNFGGASSTSLTLNDENVDPKLKAQFIREIPLTKLKFQTSFPDAGLFSQLIEEAQKASKK